MISPAAQLQLDVRIPTRRPLLPMDFCKPALDRDEDQVLSLIYSGVLIAFDVSRKGSSKICPVVWRGSIARLRSIDDGRGTLTADETPVVTVIEDVLGSQLDSFRATEVRAMLGSKVQGHIAHLLEDGLMAVDLRRLHPGRGRGKSPHITRGSIAEFLNQRRIS